MSLKKFVLMLVALACLSPVFAGLVTDDRELDNVNYALIKIESSSEAFDIDVKILPKDADFDYRITGSILDESEVSIKNILSKEESGDERGTSDLILENESSLSMHKGKEDAETSANQDKPVIPSSDAEDVNIEKESSDASVESEDNIRVFKYNGKEIKATDEEVRKTVKEVIADTLKAKKNKEDVQKTPELETGAPESGVVQVSEKEEKLNENNEKTLINSSSSPREYMVLFYTADESGVTYYAASDPSNEDLMNKIIKDTFNNL